MKMDVYQLVTDKIIGMLETGVVPWRRPWSSAGLPRNLVTTLVQPLIEDDGISSTTAWSNNVSIYSLPTRRGDLLATDESLLNWVSDALEEEFGQQTIDVPSAVGFCMAIPTAVIRQVGIMDPAFGRGYSEEIDWCLRSHAAGFRSVLCPSCFVYHAGSGVTRAEGMIEGVDNLVDAHQAIIDERYPLYRSQVTAWLASSIPNGLRERGLQHLLVTASRQLGSRVDATQSTIDAEDDLVCFGIDPSQPAWVLVASFKGFSMNFPVGEGGVLATVEAITGRPPSSVRIDRRGPISTELRRSLDQRADIVLECPPYMAHVF